MLEAVVSQCIFWRAMLDKPLLLPQHCRTQCKGVLLSLSLYGSKIPAVGFLPQMMERAVGTGVRIPFCFGDKADFITKIWIGHLKQGEFSRKVWLVLCLRLWCWSSTDVHVWLLGVCISRASPYPCVVVGSRGQQCRSHSGLPFLCWDWIIFPTGKPASTGRHFTHPEACSAGNWPLPRALFPEVGKDPQSSCKSTPGLWHGRWWVTSLGAICNCLFVPFVITDKLFNYLDWFFFSVLNVCLWQNIFRKLLHGLANCSLDDVRA